MIGRKKSKRRIVTAEEKALKEKELAMKERIKLEQQGQMRLFPMEATA